jgi:hypothetical protein
MCGRYRRTTAQEELARRYHLPIPPQRDLAISWNIAPTQDVLAIRLHPETMQRTVDTLRWGLLPNWPKIQKSRTRPFWMYRWSVLLNSDRERAFGILFQPVGRAADAVSLRVVIDEERLLVVHAHVRQRRTFVVHNSPML